MRKWWRGEVKEGWERERGWGKLVWWEEVTDVEGVTPLIRSFAQKFVFSSTTT